MTALADQAERERISQDTSTTLFVNAGAGSGKTRALVDRVATLVLRHDVRLANIAAVTFTEKAGAELRDRLRSRFEAATREDHTRERANGALEDLDGAAIGTLHSFARRILAEHPIEAGLPPIIEVLDEVGSSVAFDERWAGLQTELLDDETVERPLLVALQLGMQLKHVRSLALLLGNDWDLLAERVLSGPEPTLAWPDLDAVMHRAQLLLDQREHCVDDTDVLLRAFDKLAEIVEDYGDAVDDDFRIDVVKRLGELSFSYGKRNNWTRSIEEIKAEAKQLTAEANTLVRAVLDQCLRILTRWVARHVLAAADARRREGQLEFHDLLVLARDLLRRHADVRAALQDTYQRLLLDEFQDTDPIQIELAVRIAAGAGGDAANWQDVKVPDGRLFIVGDAKQSIYRFRRADIGLYLDAQERIGTLVALTTNFRSAQPVVDWVNAVFGELIGFEQGRQPAYEPLACFRSGLEDGPGVTVLGPDAHEDAPNAALLREREAVDVAAAIHQVLDAGWTVWDAREESWRPARREDIAILVPARTSLPYLEEALDAAGVPYRAEASSLVYHAAEVRSLLAAARTIADPSDALALVAALRSPMFGCGDDDLWRWKHAGGRFSIYSELDGSEGTEQVGTALAYLRRLAARSRWMAPSEVLATLVADRRMLEVEAGRPRARDAWRRLRFVIDQARAWSEISPGGLRAYLAWAALQGQELSRVAEAVLPETDADAVRIMTVHAAKGLEFPIVILSGMTSQERGARGVQLLWPSEGGYAVKLRKGVETGDFDVAAPVDEQMDRAEKLRLLYVATTRARDHLVVSLHRSAKSKAKTAASALASAGGVTAAGAVPFSGHSLGVPGAARESAAPPPSYAEWLRFAETARAATRAHPAISASGLEGTEPEVALDPAYDPGRAKGQRDLDLPPWSKGRYGSAIGRAVHAVLQIVDLTSGAGLDEAVAAQAMAEGVAGHEVVMRQLAESALSAGVVRRAAAREHWRETYVGTVRDDGVVLEGFVDLLFREDDGALVIVDYKTDAVPAAAIGSRVAYYRPQMDAYREALIAATGAEVRATLLFLNPTEAHEVAV